MDLFSIMYDFRLLMPPAEHEEMILMILNDPKLEDARRAA